VTPLVLRDNLAYDTLRRARRDKRLDGRTLLLSLGTLRDACKRHATACAAVSLFVANLWIVKRLLFAEYINQMYSIEGTHIAVGRHILEHWPDLHWFPLWYGGVPFPNTYLALHPFLVAITAAVFGLSAPHAYHLLTAVFYSLGPVALFFLALKLSGSRWHSFAAAVIYAFSSSSSLLIAKVSHDVGGFWHARRLQALVEYGEGPHIASMTLLPLALLVLIVAFEKRKPWWWAAAALGMAAMALTNWIGAFSYAVAAASWLLVARVEDGWSRWLKVAGLGAWAYAMVCVWLPPSTIRSTLSGESTASGSLAALPRLTATLAGILLFFALWWLLKRIGASPAVGFSILFLFVMAYLTLMVEWGAIAILLQADRLHLEMEMAIALAVRLVTKPIIDWSPRRVRVAAACLILLLGVYGAVKFRAFSRKTVHAIDVTRTIEYREAMWVARNFPGQRVLLPGSVGFFLNVFTGQPQLEGGYYQGIVNPFVNDVLYQIRSGDNAGVEEGAIAAMWLKAFGVDAVGVSGPKSEEPYKPYTNPKKFDGVLPEVWRDGDDVVYRVPRRSTSLAHVVRLEDLPARPPVSSLDVDSIRPYLRALDDASRPVAAMAWRNQDTARIAAHLGRGDILSVQVSYHPGWVAFANGRSCRVFRDNLGQLAVAPECAGPCQVEIANFGGTEMLLASEISWTAILGGLAWLASYALRKPRGARENRS